MPKSPRTELFLLLLVGVCFLHAAWAQTPPTVAVRHIQVLGSKNVVEIEIEASDRVVPETRVLTGPDRLVVDIPNAVPGNQLRSQSVNRGEVKDVRVGLFQAKLPFIIHRSASRLLAVSWKPVYRCWYPGRLVSSPPVIHRQTAD